MNTHRLPPVLLAATLLIHLTSTSLIARDVEPRVVVAKNIGNQGTLLFRENDERNWQPLAASDPVFSGDQLLALPGMRAVIESANHGATLTLAGNLPQLSTFPGLESSVTLHDTSAFDIDVTLSHGRILLKNRHKEGAAKLWLRLPTESWQLTLQSPGDEVAVEMYGRWPRGIPFAKKSKPEDVPTRVVSLLVLTGKAELKVGGTTHALVAPPGAGFFHWDSVGGADAGPQRRDALPAWANPGAQSSTEVKAVTAVVDRYLAKLQDRSPDAALLQLLADAEQDKDKDRAALTREFAVYGLAAVVDLGHVADALADAKNVGTREAAVIALRNWIGARPDRDMQLYRVFSDVEGYTPAEAETVLQLLHSPFVVEQPETYESLIEYLNHKKIAVRELARWQLYHLAPVGHNIPYDAAAAPEDRAKSIKAWKELIPSGQLPPKEKKK
jgi:hypothetical protein